MQEKRRRKQQQEQRKVRRERKQRREQLRREVETVPDLIKRAQRAFNRYIRLRDSDQPCISCGRYTVGGEAHGGHWDCGHYRSIGACPELRFEPLNAHKQCKHCNRDKSGNHIEYRIRLVERIGIRKVEWLEGPHEPKKWDKEELRALNRRFSRLAREMEKSLD